MAMINHWGKWISDKVPAGGVVNVSSVEFLDELIAEGSVIDLTYEEGLKEYLRHKTGEMVSAFWAGVTDDDPHDDPSPSEEMIEEWREEYSMMDQPPSTYLVGGWVKDDEGLYGVDPNAEYSAIVDYDSFTAQIVKSVWVTRGALCSPCYPGQIDIDTAGDWLGYDFPPELYGDRRSNPNPAIQWQAADHVG